jgi:hypothetical protein
VLLTIGAWVATLALTEMTCWIARDTTRAGLGGGGILWERIPPTDTLTLGPGVVASSCASGMVTPTGIAVAAVLLVVAVLIAAAPGRRQPPAETAAAS